MSYGIALGPTEEHEEGYGVHENEVLQTVGNQRERDANHSRSI